jgi:hypothetical protein
VTQFSRTLSRQNLRQFHSWLEQTDLIRDQPRQILDDQGWAATNNLPIYQFVDHISQSFGTLDCHLAQRLSIRSGSLQQISIQPKKRNLNFLKDLEISNQWGSIIALHDFSIKELLISNYEACNVTLSNLRINRLILLGPGGDMRLEDCLIGTIVLVRGSCARNFSANGEAIFNIECPAPTQENPFTGSVHFARKVFLPRRSGQRMRGAQAYRNLRAHMAKLVL